MAEVVHSFRSPVWVWTYASGPDAGVTRFHSPQRFCIDDRTPLVLRQANGRAQNRAWVSSNPAAFVRHELGDDKLPTIVDAHGVIARNGWSKSTWQYAAKGDEETYVPYHRGERVWIDQSLRPARTAHSNRIGVISVDTLECFSIPSSYICFVPQLVRDANTTWPTYATLAGPVHSEIWEGQARSIQAYFEWPAGSSSRAACRWDTWRETPGDRPESRALDAFDAILSVNERNRLFRLHWNIMTEALGQSCTARGCLPPTVIVKRERVKHEGSYNKDVKADSVRSFPPNARLSALLSAGLDEKDTVNVSLSLG
jgi:hypothetical protein